MKILYVSSIPSSDEFTYMKTMLRPNIDRARYGMYESGFKFHHLILDGMASNEKNSIYSLVGRPISHSSYKGLFWKNKKCIENNVIYEHIGLLNIPVLKNIFVCLSYFFKTLKWIKKNKNEDKCIIIDAAYVTVLPFINLATKIRKCKKISIVCDIYEYMADVNDARENKSKFHKFYSKLMKKQYKEIDGFVFLTEAMNEVLNYGNKPYIVMEGLVDVNMKTSENNLKNKCKKNVVMYAGALREKYGLKNLVEGFMKYKDKMAELWIYGAGDYTPVIEECSLKDKRIKYFGIVPNSLVVEKELEASVLINPRPSNLEFTKYSFPSKNMEYMVSGTPIITAKLPGLPLEYLDYVYIFEDESSDGIAKILKDVFGNSREVLNKKGLMAKDFVLSYKNNIVQSQRILDLCEEVNNENN